MTARLPDYPDRDAALRHQHHLQSQAPLLTYSSLCALQQALVTVHQQRAFILQLGDCAEKIDEATPEHTRMKVAFLNQVTNLCEPLLRRPVITIGRLAGQFAKPRQQALECRDGTTLPSYYGDLYNRAHFDRQCRRFDPENLRHAYRAAAIVMRSLQDYQRRYVHPLYTSHDALNLYYERALTRKAQQGILYNAGTHLPWLGARTAISSPAHWDYLRTIANPIGIKVCPALSINHTLHLLHLLNPQKKPGKITLILRLGVSHIENHLPQFIDAVRRHQHPVLWMLDPMHGNTTTYNGIKTRFVNDIYDEITLAQTLLQRRSLALQGLHLEATHKPVTECIGLGVRQGDLCTFYDSPVDPRLNRYQVLSLLPSILPTL